MNQRQWTNVILVILIVALGVVVVFEPGIKSPSVDRRIVPLAPENIRSINITRLQETPIQLEKNNSRWMVKSTFADKEATFDANDWKVENLLKITAVESSQTIALNEQRLGEYGLAPARVQIKVNEIVIEFGEINPVTHLRYLRVGNSIFLCSENIYSHLISEHKDFVSKSLLPDHPSIVSLQLPEFTIQQRTDKPGWKVSPPSLKPTADAVQTLVDEWRFAQAMDIDFVAKFPSKQKAVLLTKDNRKIEMSLVNENKDLLIFRPDLGIRYRFPMQTSKQLREFNTNDKP